MKERYRSKVAVYLILTRELNGKKEILLQKRCNTGYMDGYYDTACSGHVEKGEPLAISVVREAKEEIGIEINEKDLEMRLLLHRYKDDYITAFFTTKRYTGIPEIKEKDKCDELQWFDINNLPENIIPHVKTAIQDINQGIIYDDGY